MIVNLANAHGAAIDLDYALTHFVDISLDFVKRHIESISNKKPPANFDTEYRSTSFNRFQRELKPVKGIVEVLDRLEIPFCVSSIIL